MARKGPDPMLGIIARESMSADIPIRTYARRADAWNASEAKPVSDDIIVRVFMRTFKARPTYGVPNNDRAVRQALREELAKARTKRIANRERLWGRLANDINNDND